MAKRFAGDIHFDVAPDVVFAAQCDPHYVVWKHEHMAAFDVSADVEEDGSHVIISSSRKLPAADPLGRPQVRRRVHPDRRGAHLVARRDRRLPAWHGDGLVRRCPDGGLRDHRAAPDGAGSLIKVVIHAKAHVPIVGGKIENIVGEQFMRALRKEQQISPQWFTE